VAKAKKRFQVWRLDAKGKPVEELITMQEAGEMLGVTSAYVTTLATTGILDRWHFSGKCALVSLKQIQDYRATYEDPARTKRGRPRIGLRKAKE
jgi:hypothetical protein